MIKHGEAPFLECSSRGFKPFSAFYAKVKCRNNKSIEEIYQGAKIFEDGRTGLSWKEAKGKKAVNQEEVTKLYHELWLLYLIENPNLIEKLENASGLSDMFGQKGHCCQATTLWEIKLALQPMIRIEGFGPTKE